MELTGRLIMVTGASSGIGRATAQLLSQLGARVILVGRNRERLAETAALLDGADHLMEPYDLSAVEQIPEWMARIAAQAGPLSGLVHSAGLVETMPLRYLKLDSLHAMMQVNVTAAIALAKGFRKKGVSAPESSVVFVSSIAGLAGAAGLASYSASKGALISVVRPLALELAPQRIRINCVAPGYVEDTGMADALKRDLPEADAALRSKHPLGLGRSVNVAHAVAFLLAETGRWISGTTLVVDGGYCAA